MEIEDQVADRRRNIIGTIIKVVGGIYTVLTSEKEMVECSIRTTAKKTRLVVGDRVEIVPNEFSAGKYIITKCLERSCYIPRPPIANLEKLLIVIAPRPEPDLLLVDKLIIYCYLNNIEPIIVINKSDISPKGFIEDISSQYYFLNRFVISAKNSEGIEDIEKYINGSFVAVCGQSAVGKSSFINALIPGFDLQTQGLSNKIDRGKHTTRVNEIYLHKDYMIADTTGFSSLELELEHKELPLYYPEFEPYLDGCKYLNCAHIKEGKDCVIIYAVADGKINKSRYDRYKDLYEYLRKKWENKYD